MKKSLHHFFSRREDTLHCRTWNNQSSTTEHFIAVDGWLVLLTSLTFTLFVMVVLFGWFFDTIIIAFDAAREGNRSEKSYIADQFRAEPSVLENKKYAFLCRYRMFLTISISSTFSFAPCDYWLEVWFWCVYNECKIFLIQEERGLM